VSREVLSGAPAAGLAPGQVSPADGALARAPARGRNPAAPDPTAPDPAAPDPAAPDPTAPDPTAPDPTVSQLLRASGLAAWARHRTSARSRTALLLACCLGAGTAIGWWGWRDWTEQRQADAAAATGRADAVGLGPDIVQPEVGRVVAAWTVVVHNPGSRTVRVKAPYPGQVAAGTSGFLEAIPRAATIGPGATVTVHVQTVVPCAQDSALLAPTLVARGADERDMQIPIDGALAVAVAVCAEQPAATRALVADGVQRSATDPDTLVLTLHSPSGRTWLVTGFAAAGIDLPARPDAGPGAGPGAGDARRHGVRVSSEPVRVVLSGPRMGAGAGCPAAWAATGVPQMLTLTVATAGEPVTIDVPAGLPLAQWLLDVACPDAAAGSGATG